MKSTITALYDCRSKQEYIYRTNRIQEISGGSDLLASVYYEFIKEANKKGMTIKCDWKTNSDFSVEQFVSSGLDGEVIYVGGGNLYMIYKDKSTYIYANKILSRMLLDNTYTISIIAACVETTDNFINDRDAL